MASCTNGPNLEWRIHFTTAGRIWKDRLSVVCTAFEEHSSAILACVAFCTDSSEAPPCCRGIIFSLGTLMVLTTKTIHMPKESWRRVSKKTNILGGAWLILRCLTNLQLCSLTSLTCPCKKLYMLLLSPCPKRKQSGVSAIIALLLWHHLLWNALRGLALSHIQATILTDLDSQ